MQDGPVPRRRLATASYHSPVPPVRFAPRLALVALLAFTLGACAQKQPVSASKAPDSLSVEQLVFTPVAPESLAAVVAASGGKATLVNVWASWCEPCREEFPELVRLARAYEGDGLRVVFVSADFTEALPDARKFLAAQGVDWPTWYKTGSDQAFIDALSPKWTGALPGTFIYDAQGKLRDSWEGKATYAKLEQSVRPVLSLPPVTRVEIDTTSKESRS
jgi:thiol-disulfide isomerase/thioredoxin